MVAFYGKLEGKYTSPMEHLGNNLDFLSELGSLDFLEMAVRSRVSGGGEDGAKNLNP